MLLISLFVQLIDSHYAKFEVSFDVVQFVARICGVVKRWGEVVMS